MGGVVTQVQRHVPQVRPHITVLGSHAAAQSGPQRGEGTARVVGCVAVGGLQQQLEASDAWRIGRLETGRQGSRCQSGAAVDAVAAQHTGVGGHFQRLDRTLGGDVAGGGDEDAVRVDRGPGGNLDPAAEPVDGGPQRPFVGDGASRGEQPGCALGPAGGVGVAGGGEQPVRSQVVTDAQLRGTLVSRTTPTRGRHGPRRGHRWPRAGGPRLRRARRQPPPDARSADQRRHLHLHLH